MGPKIVLAFFLLLAAVGPTSATLTAQQNCEPCRPIRSYNASLSGHYVIQIQGNIDPAYNIDSTQGAAIAAGIQEYWGKYFEDNNINITFSFDYCILGGLGGCNPSEADMVVFADDPENMENEGAAAEAEPTAYGVGAYIRIDREWLGVSWVNWKNMAGHEFGHILGFGNNPVTSTCPEGSSIMQSPTSTTFDFYATGLPVCSDNLGLSMAYLESPYLDPEEQEFQLTEDNCWDVYGEIIYICSDGETTWECGRTGWQYWGNTCNSCCWFYYD